MCFLARNDTNRVKLGSIGGCEAVVATLQVSGKTDKDTAISGFKAVSILAISDANSTKLGNIGGCEAVVDALQAWGKTDMDVVNSGCDAVWNLALYDANELKLKSLGLGALLPTVLAGETRDELLSLDFY